MPVKSMLLPAGAAFCLFIAVNETVAQSGCENPNSTFEFVGNVNTYFCEGPNGLVTVDITVDENNDPACISYMVLDWGDGDKDTLPANDFGNKTHIYNYPDSIACDLSAEQLNPEVKLTLYFKNGKLNKRTQSLAITPLPRGKIGALPPLCANVPVTFTVVDSCYVDSLYWDFGSGPTTSPTTIYSTPGFKTVKLCVLNDCGQKCIQQLFFIREKPDVSAIAVSAVPASGCLPLDVTFTPTVQEVDDYEWAVVSPDPCAGCYNFVPATGKDSVEPVIRFVKEGVYTVQLTGKNDCGSDVLTTEIQVYAPPQATISSAGTIGCKTLNFNPQVTYPNLNPGSITAYQWIFPKGSPSTSSIPKPINIQYVNNADTLLTDTVRLIVSGPCGSKIYTVVVKVYGDTQVNFMQPPAQVCTGDAPFFIAVTPAPPLGNFSITPNSPALNLSTGYFNPALALPGNYTVTYTVDIPGAPAGCQSSKSIAFSVKTSAPVAITVPDKFCVDAPLQTFFSNPASGGLWSAQGIVNASAGQYDPSKAGAGADTVFFSFTDTTGCISKASKIVEIVGIPAVDPPDTVVTCLIAQPVLLEQLDNFTFSPNGGLKTWAGTGVTNPQTGEFLSPATGNYNVSITYTVPPGCDTTVQFVVQVEDFIVASAGANDTVCQIQGKHTLVGTPGGGKWSGSPNIDSITGEINLTAEMAGNHTYTYTIRAGTPCESSDQMALAIVPGNGVSVNQSLDYVCETALSYTLPVASPPGGVWSGPAVSGGVVNVAALDTGIYQYIYTVSDLPDACNEATFTLVVAAQPSANFALMPDTACIGNTAALMPSAPGADTSFVDWGDNTPAGPSLSHQYNKAGDFTVLFSVMTKHPLSGATLCDNKLSKNIHIVAPPQLLSFSMDKDTGCAPLSVIFTNESIAENGAYFWDFGNGDTLSGFAPPGPVVFKQGTEDTTYTVRLTVRTGCDSLVFTRQVTVLPQPRADFGITYEEPCSGDTLLINNTSTGNPVNNRWTTSTGLIFNAFNPPWLQFFSAAAPDTVSITLVSSNQCGADTLTKSVTVNPADVVALINITDTTEVCAGDTVTLTSYSTPGALLRWKTSQGNTFLGGQLKLTFAQAGIYKITLYAEGCGFDSMNTFVRVHPLPELSVQHPLIICPGDTADFQVLTDADGSRLYFGTGDSSDLKNAQYRYLQSGVYPLGALATSLEGCIKKWSGSLEVAPRPEALAQAPDSVCSGANALFQSLSSNGLSCIWAFGDGDFSDNCQPQHAYAVPGLYTAALTVISNIGCRDTALVPVYVRLTPSAVPVFQYLERCTPAKVLFTSQSSGATQINWDFGNGATANISTATVTYTQGGAYKVLLIATNEGICSDTGEVTVELWQTPLFNFELKENCTVAEGADLHIHTPNGNLPTVTGPGHQQDGNFHQGLGQGFFDVSIVSPEGCKNDTTIFVPKPTELLLKVAEDSFDIQLGESVQLDAIVNQLDVIFHWEPGKWLSSDTVADPLATPFRTVTYVVVATDLKGCVKMDTVFISVLIERDSGLYIPDIFSPNDDGVNDIFFVRSVNPSIERLEDFKILDKYGEILHNIPECLPEQSAFGWDGSFKGEKAEMGVYRYQVVVVYKDGEKAPKSGFLLLAR